MTSESHDWSLWSYAGLRARGVVFIGLIWAVLVYGQSLTPAVATTADGNGSQVPARYIG